MNAPTPGRVYVRSELLYFASGRVHLSNTRDHALEPQDQALLELVYRGASDFGLLCGRLAELAPDASAATIAAQLAPRLRDPRSIVDLRDDVPMSEPDVIVCDFSGSTTPIDSRHLVRELRRRHRVLFLGHDDIVDRPGADNLSFARARATGRHGTWFEFAQWCRGTVARFEHAVLVLCGEQDVILFGDLVPTHRTLVALSPTWPPPTGGEDLLGPDWVPDDPLDEIRALFYALVFHPPDEFNGVNRTSSSAFARLEAYALRHATTVAVSAIDQIRPLVALGRDASTCRVAHGVTVQHRRRRIAGPLVRSLVLVASVDQGAAPLVPYIGLLNAIPPVYRSFDEVLVRAAPGWFRFDVVGATCALEYVGDGPPATSECVAAILFPGLMRVLWPAFDVMARGIPMLLVPSAHAHPLQECMLPEARIEVSRPDVVARRLAEITDAGNGLAERLRAAQARALQDHSIVQLMPPLLADRGAHR